MKKYSFRLSAVLRLRRAEESRERDHLTACDRRLREAIVARDREADRYGAISVCLGDMTIESFRAEEFGTQLAARSLADAQRQVTERAGEAALAQIAWVAASRKVKIIERLDERRRIEYRATEDKADRDLVDDLVTTRFVLGQLENEIELAR